MKFFFETGYEVFIFENGHEILPIWSSGEPVMIEYTYCTTQATL